MAHLTCMKHSSPSRAVWQPASGTGRSGCSWPSMSSSSDSLPSSSSSSGGCTPRQCTMASSPQRKQPSGMYLVGSSVPPLRTSHPPASSNSATHRLQELSASSGKQFLIATSPQLSERHAASSTPDMSSSILATSLLRMASQTPDATMADAQEPGHGAAAGPLAGGMLLPSSTSPENPRLTQRSRSRSWQGSSWHPASWGRSRISCSRAASAAER
mmetsp:Transcript_40755/g.107691  ORF Transcript_40755/g.107691 Transcript_40755/m.107691 type:complete len:215 (-) Transcript_40755:321-965(-)